MNYLKRYGFVVALLLFLVALVTVFLPSQLLVKKVFKVVADKELVEKKIAAFDYRQLGPYTINPNNETWELNDLGNELEVISTLNIPYGFNPISKMYGFFTKKEVIVAMQYQLDSLQAILADLPKIQGVKVNKVFRKNDLWFLSIRDTVNQLAMSNIHGKLYAEINRFMDDHKIHSTEAPIAIYHYWSDTIIDIEVGIPVEETTQGNDRVKMNQLKKGYAVTATHYGPYEKLPETYFGINEWIRENEVIITGVPWETYLTDPSNEPNQEKWETAIFFPIKE